mgnify:CR=1 FL=1
MRRRCGCGLEESTVLHRNARCTKSAGLNFEDPVASATARELELPRPLERIEHGPGPVVSQVLKERRCRGLDRSAPVVIDVEARIFLREDVDRLGLLPLTSMFWFGEYGAERLKDWRPEVHDSDGLALWTGSGERIWRPLNNPDATRVSAFADENPKGFGLMQRDRNFDHYQDGVFYDRRPSVWVEPLKPLGKGSVQSLLPLGRDAALKLTTARYFTPSGHSVQEGGIDPDITVPQLSDPDLAKRARFQMRESDLRGHLVNELGLADDAVEKDSRDDPRFQQTADELKAKGIEDFQLHYALETLRRTSPKSIAARAK